MQTFLVRIWTPAQDCLHGHQEGICIDAAPMDSEPG